MSDRDDGSVDMQWRKVCMFILFVVIAAGCNRGVSADVQTLLVAKAQVGDVKAIEQAIGKGADVNQEWMLNTPLSWAIQGGHIAAVKFLVLKGAKINARFGLPERTALQQAAEGGHVDIVVYLVEAGADVNARNKFGRTALHHARRVLGQDPKKAEEVARYLVSKGAVE